MRKARVVVALALLSCWFFGAKIAAMGDEAPDPLHVVHDALFASFLPIDELNADPHFAAMLANVRDGIWSAAGQSQEFRGMLAPFADLRSFGNACGIAGWLHADVRESFAALDRKQREHVLTLLETCDANEPRRLAMTVRGFYLSRGYGPIQEMLSGIVLQREASHAWIEEHRPHLPATRLRYDRASREIVLRDGSIDDLIVGSGPAGSVLAHELRRGGKRVLLVDRGSFIVPGSMETRMIGDLVDARTSEDGGIFIHNGMAVGGGSQVNVDLCFAPTLPAIQAKIDSWRDAGRIGRDDFTLDQIRAAYEWVKSAIGTRRLTEAEINANNRVLWEGARREGLHPKLYDRNIYPPGQSPYPVTDKRSAESQLLMGALEDAENPLSMIPDADVRRVLFAAGGGDRRAVGVEIRMRAPIPEEGAIADPNGLGIGPGEMVTIHARTVILAAGALGSPAILLRSGLDNEQIGHGVILHPSMPVLGKFDRMIDAMAGTQASVYVDDRLMDRGYALESMSAEPVYAAIMSPGPAMHIWEVVRSYRNLAGFGVMLIDTAAGENRLVVDKQGEPKIEYRLSEQDKERFREGVTEAVRVMLRAGAREVYLPTTEDLLGRHESNGLQPLVLTSIDEAAKAAKNLQFIPNRTILTSAHMQATDKMGAGPKDSVVGRDFHVWGTKELYVVDGSVFPTSIGANPMQSIYTFAKIFADGMSGAGGVR
jgi:choline dehydrogenase-like flavoprotein